jgi:hypothetical protein
MRKKYELRTVADFAKIPSDKIDECMADFAYVLKTWDEEKKNPAPGWEFLKNCFVWIDDGKREISQVQVYREGEIDHEASQAD